MPAGEFGSLELGGIPAGVLPLAKSLAHAKFELSVNVSGSGVVVVDYMTELFDAATIERLAASYIAVLDAATAQPMVPVDGLAIMGPADRQLLAHFSCGPLRPEHLEGPLFHEAFASVASQHPGRRCLVFEGAEMSYGQVNAAADALAASLAAMDVVRGSPVGIMLDRSFELVIAILGVLKAGGGCVVGWSLPVLHRGC